MQQIQKKATLTKGQLHRAVESFDIGTPKRITLIPSGVINANYIVRTNEGKFIIRSYTFKPEKEVMSELTMLRMLAKKNFPCPRPIGKVLVDKTSVIACFRYIEGRPVVRITTNILQRSGALLANLHLLSRNYVPHYPREGEGVTVIRRYVKEKKQLILKSAFPGRKEFVAFLEQELSTIRLPQGLPRGIAHVDVKPENIIIDRRGKMHFIDFDNAYIDYFVMDVGSTISWLCFTDGTLDPKKVQHFLHAYESVRSLSLIERRTIAPCLRFTLLKHAFKYAYICLPQIRFAAQHALSGLQLYKNLDDDRIEQALSLRKHG